MGVFVPITRQDAERKAREAILRLLSDIENMADEELAKILDDNEPSYENYQIIEEI